MKRINRIQIMAACAALFTAGIAPTAFSQGAKETNIAVLDSVAIDGEAIDYEYSISSKCSPRDHDSWLEVNTKTRLKVVESFIIVVVDSAYENECDDRSTKVAVSGSGNIGDVIADKSKELKKKGYKISQTATFVLPPVRTAGLAYSTGVSGNVKPPAVVPPPAAPVYVDVTEITYTPAWRCMLYKNDGSRSDGFEGIGATLPEARRAASAGCKATNNPSCDKFSESPVHTTCDAVLKESSTVARYDSTKLPANVIPDSWACTLNKNDGSTYDGFTGIGKTEASARADAASKCSTTNVSKCASYSTDSSHTTCSQSMTHFGPKPVAVWKCTLWKNDGSRKDGFTGTGSTESEARRSSVSGCQRTNNPNCTNYSNDPDHTQCTVDFVYPQ